MCPPKNQGYLPALAMRSPTPTRCISSSLSPATTTRPRADDPDDVDDDDGHTHGELTVSDDRDDCMGFDNPRAISAWS